MIEDLIHGWKELEDAYPGYLQAKKMYEGHPDEVFADPKIAALVKETGASYRFNFVKTPVNVLANRLSLSAITVPGSEELTDTLSAVFDANDMDVHFPDAFTKALEFGDAYIMVWPLDEADQAPDTTGALADLELQAAGVEITVHTPQNTRLIYDEENERRKAYQIRRWCLRGPGDADYDRVWRVDLYYADRIERFISRPGAEPEEATSWELFLGDDQAPEDWLLENPWGEVPWFHFRTDLPYGVPVHEAGYGCQNAINKLLITELTTVDSHGWPQRYQLTDPAAELDSAHDVPDWESDDEADDTSDLQGGSSSNLRFGPGTIATLHGAKAVGQFDAADPNVFMEPTEKFVRFMAQICETPLHSFDFMGQVPSGESLKVAEAPLNKRTMRMWALFRSPLIEMAQLILKMRGTKPGVVEVRWDAPDSATGVEDWQVIAAKQTAGVPVDQTLVEAGYDPEQVARWLDDQGEAMDLGHRVDLLGKIGAAVQSIGSGVALGVVDQADATAIIAMVLNQATESNPEPA